MITCPSGRLHLGAVERPPPRSTADGGRCDNVRPSGPGGPSSATRTAAVENVPKFDKKGTSGISWYQSMPLVFTDTLVKEDFGLR
ncbi:hypothetical protein MTO96_044708 [Rhipicephalus appendiculatus]